MEESDDSLPVCHKTRDTNLAHVASSCLPLGCGAWLSLAPSEGSWKDAPLSVSLAPRSSKDQARKELGSALGMVQEEEEEEEDYGWQDAQLQKERRKIKEKKSIKCK